MPSKFPRTANLESLESRRLLSVSLLNDLPDITVTPASQRSAAPAAVSTSIDGYTPAQIRKAYGFDKITLANGATADGAGQTIAVITAYNNPNILSDLHTFDAAMGVNDKFSLSVVSQTGGQVRSIPTDAGWAGETALDVEWAHAIAPNAKILLVEADSASLSDLMTAVDFARNAAGVSVVSMSWGADEFSSQASYDKHFTTPAGHQGVTFVAASGDNGSLWGPSWPSSSSHVLAVGGTTLGLDTTTGATTSETAWDGSGGGFSSYTSEPAYQATAQGSGVRSAPDVSYNANPFTGFAFYNSVDDGSGQVGWNVVGGTSAGTPQWAALVAIANQGRAAVGKGSLDGATGTLPTLYSLYKNPSAYSAAFTDVTLGRSSVSTTARAGYDAVTGLGSPKAAGVVNALVGGTTAAKAATTTTTAASRRARAQLARKALAEQTVAQSTTPFDVIAPPTAATFAAKRVADSLLADGSASRTFTLQRPSDTVITTTTVAAARSSVFSTHRVATTFSAGYESARPAPVTLAGSEPSTATPAVAMTEATGPWILSGIASIETATPGIAAFGNVLPVLPAPATAAIVPDVAAATGLTRPRAVTLAVVAAAAEVLILSYRRSRRKHLATATDTRLSTVEPVVPDDH